MRERSASRCAVPKLSAFCEAQINKHMKYSIAILGLCLLASCSGGNESMDFGGELASPRSEAVSSDEGYLAQAQYESDEYAEADTDQKHRSTKPEQKIIRTAEVQMEVEDYEKSLKTLNKLLEQYKATISNEAETRWDTRIQNLITIRIAPEKLDDFILNLDQIALEIKNKSISSRDVTRQYVDLETRLASKRAVVKRYTELLESAQSVSEVLEVEEKLRLLIEEIESAEAQLRSLKGQVEQSTINLTLYETLRAPITKGRSFFKQVGNAFVDGWGYLKDFLIGLMRVWPFLFIGVGLVYVVRRERRRRRNIAS